MPENKDELRSAIMRFLRQRKSAAHALYTKHKDSKLIKMQILCTSLITKFNLIQNFNYWRHCREVSNHEDAFYSLLPSSNGKHASIRERMIRIIEGCKKINAMGYVQFTEFNRDKTKKYDRSWTTNTAAL